MFDLFSLPEWNHDIGIAIRRGALHLRAVFSFVSWDI
jgi:hypothetical protein